jgi:hypothetical protein
MDVAVGYSCGKSDDDDDDDDATSEGGDSSIITACGRRGRRG